MADTTTINRTYHPKYVTYTGDGSGRDGYVTFANGGLHELRDYQGSRPRHPFNNFKNQPVHVSQPHKEPTAFDYVPDGTGRDSYVIFNYGLKANYRSGYKEFEKDLRSGTETPMMDARQAKRNDPWGTDVSSYRNWPSPTARANNRQVFDEQRASVERLSKSPPNKHRTKFSSTEKLQVMMPVPQKHQNKIMNQTQVLKLSDDIGKEQFFSSRNVQPMGAATTTAMKNNSQSAMRSVQTSRKNESLNIGPIHPSQVQRTFHNRKHSVGVPATTQNSKKLLVDFNGEAGNDYTPAFRKKMSMPQAQLRQRERAHSTLQYANNVPAIQNSPGQHRITTTAEPMNRTGIRFKKVGNLMALEQSHSGGAGRTANVSKQAGPNNNLFLRNIFNEQQQQTGPAKMQLTDLEQLKYQNQQLRQRIGINQQHSMAQSRPAEKALSSLEHGGMNIAATAQTANKPLNNNRVTITDQLRKNLNSELYVKKMDTEMTNGRQGISTMDTSVNGTRFDQRRSIDRTMINTANNQNELEYGSVMSPSSPVKQGRANLALSGHKVQRTEAKQFYERRNTTTHGREGSYVKRSSSVQQKMPKEVSAIMAKTAPQGFFKHQNVEQ